jgi:tetraacyldisaccharide 4'-kinase
MRNTLYDHGLFSSSDVAVKSIVIGNISAGGTGKTPFVLWLLNRYAEKSNVAVLSRGYGRKTKGFFEVSASANAHQIGDEPLLIKQRHPGTSVFVCEDRVAGANKILEQIPEVGTLILDDAFQHRRFNPGISILLTTWDQPFTDDWYLPTGNLRDWKGAYARANAVVITKCPSHLPLGSSEKWRKKIALHSDQKLAFSTIEYGPAIAVFGTVSKEGSKIILISGIADSRPFESHCGSQYEVLKHFKFQDHHSFKPSEIAEILNSIGSFGESIGIITTEKDATRLKAFSNDLNRTSLSYIPIETKFLLGEEEITGLTDPYILDL